MIVKNYHLLHCSSAKMDLLSDIEGYTSDEESIFDSDDNSSLDDSLFSNNDYMAMMGLSHADTIRSQQTTFDANASVSSLGTSFWEMNLSDSIAAE